MLQRTTKLSVIRTIKTCEMYYKKSLPKIVVTLKDALTLSFGIIDFFMLIFGKQSMLKDEPSKRVGSFVPVLLNVICISLMTAENKSLDILSYLLTFQCNAFVLKLDPDVYQVYPFILLSKLIAGKVNSKFSLMPDVSNMLWKNVNKRISKSFMYASFFIKCKIHIICL